MSVPAQQILQQVTKVATKVLAQELLDRVQELPAFKDLGFYAFNEVDATRLTRFQEFPLVVVAYAGMTVLAVVQTLILTAGVEPPIQTWCSIFWLGKNINLSMRRIRYRPQLTFSMRFGGIYLVIRVYTRAYGGWPGKRQ